MEKNSITNVFIWQLLGKFALQGIAFITVPIFTRIMLPEEYGMYALYSSWVSLVSVIIGLQTSGAIPNARIKYPIKQYKEYLSSALSISFFSFILFSFICISLRKIISNVLQIDSYLIFCILLQSFFNYCLDFYLTCLIQEKKSKKNAIISILVSGSGTILALLFVLYLKIPKYSSKIFGYLIPIIIGGGYSIVLIFSQGKTYVNKEYYRYCSKFAIPFIFHCAAGVVFNQCDRVMLKYLESDASVGIYTISYNLGMVINVVLSVFTTTWNPFYFDMEKRKDFSQIKQKSNSYIRNFTIITICFILCSPELFKIIAPMEYWEGIKLVPIIAISFYFRFLYTFPSTFELFMEKANYFSIISIVVAIINVIGNYLLIPHLSIMGAAITTLLSNILLFLIHDFIVRILFQKGRFAIDWILYLKGIIPVVLSLISFFVLFEYYYIRWIASIIIGIILLVKWIKERSLF